MEGLIPGRIVHYVLSEDDAERINRRRVPGAGNNADWPKGAQAHVGNPVSAGDHLSGMIVFVHPEDEIESHKVNIQVFLDGNDQYWACEIPHSVVLVPNSWHWPTG